MLQVWRLEIFLRSLLTVMSISDLTTPTEVQFDKSVSISPGQNCSAFEVHSSFSATVLLDPMPPTISSADGILHNSQDA